LRRRSLAERYDAAVLDENVGDGRLVQLAVGVEDAASPHQEGRAHAERSALKRAAAVSTASTMAW
jgi:hypothetical protein